MKKVLIIDDEKSVRSTLSTFLSENGFAIVESDGGTHAETMMREESPDAVMLDLNMPEVHGLDLLPRLVAVNPDTPIIILTAYGDISTAVEAIKKGAYDFLEKPPRFDRLSTMLERAIEKTGLVTRVRQLESAVESSLAWEFGKSAAMKKVLDQVRQVAPTDFSIIIQGETGTGKSMLARAIHNHSLRSAGPFVNVDMGVLPETLVESELFGYEKGAFTGANRPKKGYFEAATSGTIFIDELENMSPYVQGKLLSVVEQKLVYPLGSTKSVPVDVRIVGATNTDIRKNVMDRSFREDLFFRLGEIFITLPPLRERLEDIPSLAEKFLHDACEELKKPSCEVSDEVMDMFIRYNWPGNVRELKNVVRRAVLFSDGNIGADNIDFLIHGQADAAGTQTALMPLKEATAIATRDAESRTIRQALNFTKGNKSKASAILEVDYKTLLKKIKQYGLE